MIRVLVVSKLPFDMRLGDAVRVINILRCLRDKYTFDLLCFVREGQSLSDEARAEFDRVTMIPFPTDTRGGVFRRLAFALSVKSIVIMSEEMRAAAETAMKSRQYALIFSIGSAVLYNLPWRKRTLPLIMDSIDSSTLAVSREWEQAAWADRLRLLRRMWLYRQMNKSLTRCVDANVYASELDASIFAQRFPGVRTEGIPNGVDATYFRPAENLPAASKSIVFEGNMMFAPNVDAAVYLCAEIVPRIVRSHPEVRVYIVGRDPVPAVRALASPHVIVTGTVPDVRDYLWRSNVFVCPMRLGAGIKNKILQAWATGMPVVATSEAMGGLDARDGENVFLRDDPTSFAETVNWLLEDPARGTKVAMRGRELAVERFSWQAQAARLDGLFDETLAKYASVE